MSVRKSGNIQHVDAHDDVHLQNFVKSSEHLQHRKLVKHVGCEHNSLLVHSIICGAIR